MEKSRLTRILSRAGSADVRALAARLQLMYPAVVLRDPMRTLVMMPMADPVRGTPFYLGELMASETMVEMAGAKGFGICMGDDFEKSAAIAVIDAAYNAGVPECEWLTRTLLDMERAQDALLQKEAAAHRDTMVSFRTMEGQ